MRQLWLICDNSVSVRDLPARDNHRASGACGADIRVRRLDEGSLGQDGQQHFR